MIVLSNVIKKYINGHVALNKVSLMIESGEMVFIQGHSGAGKSTLLKLIGLLERPTKGDIIVNAKNIQEIPKFKIPYYRRQLGFISQNPRLLLDSTAFENVAMPLIIAGFDKLDIAKRVRAALEKVGLLSKENCYPRTLSEGERQRLGIARAVVHKPRLLLADEPTGNLDPSLALEIMQLFERFNQVGVTVLIASHDINLMDKFAHRKLTLSQGQLIDDTNALQTRLTTEHEELSDV